MTSCRGCGETSLFRVMDLGKVPAAKHFPPVSAPVNTDEMHELAMDLCEVCGLVQLADDDTIADEPRGLEPQALIDQAQDAINRVAAAGWLRGNSVLEFGSPHGGTWIQLLTERGFTPTTSTADVVLDSFGIMHEPDQQSAFQHRARVTGPDGVLLLQYHSIASIVRGGQWNSLRHGHFAYYSLTALNYLLRAAGMHIATAWEFDLYGGTNLVAAVHADVEPDETVRRILAAEAALGVTDPAVISGLQSNAAEHVDSLLSWLRAEKAAGRTVFGYGAASRAVAVFKMAGIDKNLVTAVADASPVKQGMRMPGTDVPIVSPEELLAADPDRVLLTLPDLLPEVSSRYPALQGRWKVDGL
ncbi:methyltransferase domain-containing protein [Mycobacterium neglectum]|uniref:methyltransferase domain-containing protein n=1 Tax=Mycobacterium neglectum TaxID=242737 RepID=UPI000BFECE4D|nr:methyltransferase domain-containing protein [Mycobacterium neglectum]